MIVAAFEKKPLILKLKHRPMLPRVIFIDYSLDLGASSCCSIFESYPKPDSRKHAISRSDPSGPVRNSSNSFVILEFEVRGKHVSIHICMQVHMYKLSSTSYIKYYFHSSRKQKATKGRTNRRHRSSSTWRILDQNLLESFDTLVVV